MHWPARPATPSRPGGGAALQGWPPVAALGADGHGISHRRWTGGVEVSGLAAAGLPAASIVRSAKVAITEAADAEQIGSLAACDRPLVRDQVAGLPAPVLDQQN